MIDEDEVKHVAMFSVRMGVSELMHGLMTEKSVGDGEAIVRAEVEETDAGLVSRGRVAPRAKR